MRPSAFRSANCARSSKSTLCQKARTTRCLWNCRAGTLLSPSRLDQLRQYLRPPSLRRRLHGRSVRNWRLASETITAASLIEFDWGDTLPPALRRQSRRRGPSARKFRRSAQPMLSNGRPVVVSLGTPMFIRFRGGRIRTSAIDDPEKARTDPRIRKILAMFNTEEPQPSYIYTGVGEAEGAFQLAKLFTRFNRDLQLAGTRQ